MIRVVLARLLEVGNCQLELAPVTVRGAQVREQVRILGSLAARLLVARDGVVPVLAVVICVAERREELGILGIAMLSTAWRYPSADKCVRCIAMSSACASAVPAIAGVNLPSLSKWPSGPAWPTGPSINWPLSPKPVSFFPANCSRRSRLRSRRL